MWNSFESPHLRCDDMCGDGFHLVLEPECEGDHEPHFRIVYVQPLEEPRCQECRRFYGHQQGCTQGK